jgi:NADPH:quinone reductase-like Zn-dependent oxidoreductase
MIVSEAHTMRAVRIHEPGGPEVLELCEVPVPEPQPDELLVRVDAVGVNRADIILRERDIPLPVSQIPEVPGLEVSSEVAGLGKDVTQFRTGDRICSLVPGAGGYAEYCRVPASLAWAVPEGISAIEVAALPEALLTV